MATRNSGFTLIEMLVVIAVMGVALLLLTGYGQPHSRWLETEAASRQVAEAMRDARGLAITQGHPVAFALPPHLPAWLPVAIQAPKGGIVFSPDGSASGGSVILGGAPPGSFPPQSAKTIVISADWLTGRVQINAP